MKVIYNATFGGFHLSRKMVEMYEEKTGKQLNFNDITGDNYELRADKDLVEIIENMSEEDCDWERGRSIRVEEIPDIYNFYIDEYDGAESVMLSWKESYVRDLIRKGDEEEVINYLKSIRNYAECDED